MHVFKRHTDLDEPVHDLNLRKALVFRPFLFHVVRKITHLTKLHDNNQHIFVNEAAAIGDNIDMVQVFQKLRLQ